MFTPATATKEPDHVTPPSTVYSVTAPASMPVTFSVPTFVILSVPLSPVSLFNPTSGAATAVSSVNTSVARLDTLPATSVCRTMTELRPCTGVNDVPHVVPPLVEYSTLAPVSTPASDSVPTRVIRSDAPAPVSLASDKPGTTGTSVSSVKEKNVVSEIFPVEAIERMATVLKPSVATKELVHTVSLPA